jgi:hypothetical protein
MNWYYIEHERDQRMKDWQKQVADAQLVHEISEKKPFPTQRFRIMLIFAALGHWLITWWG